MKSKSLKEHSRSSWWTPPWTLPSIMPPALATKQGHQRTLESEVWGTWHGDIPFSPEHLLLSSSSKSHVTNLSGRGTQISHWDANHCLQIRSSGHTGHPGNCYLVIPANFWKETSISPTIILRFWRVPPQADLQSWQTWAVLYCHGIAYRSI